MSVPSDHPAEEVLGALPLVHPVHLACLIIGNALADFSLQRGAVDESIVLRDGYKAVAAVSP